MEKIIKIGEKEIKFRATAATPVKYRSTFGKDVMVELMNQASDKFDNFEVLENLAYIMAGGEGLEMTIEDWLDQFELTEFYGALEDVLALWNDSQQTTSDSKSKNAIAAGR